ncbi:MULTISPECIES: formate/nitrite transporter family protein [Acidiphilium]|jgi:formate/nitrite transporter|uniref:Formate/nitrite transporter n=2 Tax=Acidiphilium TaxID=522 RepID=A5FWS3_ACICJ|nr:MULTISPECIES: formate/nitrite transporter family protein [Acidiphilium]MBU6358040.1 formate/nitrite transporter family protein [Rhodospirillales bacterium]ABQ30055.1 formate/nitrite transporter [Acidiphilium cryptum JF-5]KDM67387.1 formate/nitrite family of transporter [Acidiphilium sp. JA12-A1]MBS3024872.1 formate/nitrite transporter family protein [Acidiphilium multivorum]MDE2327919.1 formate/nitrite transporter family protein [Rhodospirillales bacterium]
MDWLKPSALAAAMMEAGAAKGNLPARTILVTGILSGLFLGFTTTLFVSALVATGNLVVSAMFFPVGFILLVLLGLELFTGNAALLPYAGMAGRLSFGSIVSGLVLVYVGNLIGSLLYAALFAAIDTKFFTAAADPIGAKIAAIAALKTIPYMKAGAAGWMTAFSKGVVCNWMVSLGAVMALVSRSVIGKIFAMYMPIMAFVAQGFEHCVVNMFVIPCGIMLGAKVSISQWWIWNEIPVTLGNIVGAVVITAFGLYVAHGATAAPEPVLSPAPAE